jgi:hypothetical protein
MPVVTKVHKDKDKLLSLFLLIDPDDVKDQLKRCREFFSLFTQDGGSKDGGGAGHNEPDEEDEGEEQKSKASKKSGRS